MTDFEIPIHLIMIADIDFPLFIINFADRSVTGCWVLGAGNVFLFTFYFLL